jgi:hypothetical protein
VSSVAHRGFVYLGMDVSKDSIALAVLSPDRDTAEVDRIFHDADSVRRLVKRLGKPKEMWAVTRRARPIMTSNAWTSPWGCAVTRWPRPSSRIDQVVTEKVQLCVPTFTRVPLDATVVKSPGCPAPTPPRR